jgi:hypothetical protein
MTVAKGMMQHHENSTPVWEGFIEEFTYRLTVRVK